MKVFDFTEGKKGEFLGETFLPTFLGPYPFSENGKPVSLTMVAPKGQNWSINSIAEHKTKITAEEYGVQAICFCVGKWTAGTDSAWEWHVIATQEWINSALKTNILKEI